MILPEEFDQQLLDIPWAKEGVLVDEDYGWDYESGVVEYCDLDVRARVARSIDAFGALIPGDETHLRVTSAQDFFESTQQEPYSRIAFGTVNSLPLWKLAAVTVPEQPFGLDQINRINDVRGATEVVVGFEHALVLDTKLKEVAASFDLGVASVLMDSSRVNLQAVHEASTVASEAVDLELDKVGIATASLKGAGVSRVLYSTGRNNGGWWNTFVDVDELESRISEAGFGEVS